MVKAQNSHKIQILPLVTKDISIVFALTVMLFAIKLIFFRLYPPGVSYFGDELFYKQNAEALFNFTRYVNPDYPPVYPLVIAPAFFLKDWYVGMLLISAFVSSLLVPATWFLARTVKMQHPLIAAGIAAILPMHSIFPAMILSENLFVPLFIVATGLALRGGVSGNVECFIFGVVLFLAHFTKYLFLPAIPLLLGVWLISRYQIFKTRATGDISKDYVPLLLVFLGYGSLVGTWVLYGIESGFSLGQIFGFNHIASATVTHTRIMSNLFMWGTAYASYIVLAWIPFWGIIAAWLNQNGVDSWRKQLSSGQQCFFVLLVLLILGYWLLATLFSFGRNYNHPDPQYLLGRYLMHLGPLILVAAVLLFEKLVDKGVKYRFAGIALHVGIVVSLALLSWNVVFTQNLWDFPRWFAQIRFNSVDVFSLSNKWVFSSSIFVALLPCFIFRFMRNNIPTVYYMFIGALFMLIFTTTIMRLTKPNGGQHAEELAGPISTFSADFDTGVHVFLDFKHLTIRKAGLGLEFFGVSKNKYVIKHGGLGDAVRQHDSQVPVLLLTVAKYEITPVKEYVLGDDVYRLYCLNNYDPKNFIPEILDYGPKKIVAGTAFHRQPSGSNAMWFKLINFSSTTQIFFDNQLLELTRGKNSVVTALVPPELTSAPGNANIHTYDTAQGMVGKSISLSILSSK